jgi:hypothetical protein
VLRAATASWLNAAVEISFPERRTWISADVTEAFESGDPKKVLELARYLDGINNQECPLDADEASKAGKR